MEDFDKVSIEDDEFRFALQQLMRGNGNYFSLVFQKTRQSLYIFALLLVKEEEAAADLLKETYLRIVESAGSLRRTRVRLQPLHVLRSGAERARGDTPVIRGRAGDPSAVRAGRARLFLRGRSALPRELHHRSVGQDRGEILPRRGAHGIP